jgi:hypothetical protein
MLDGVSALELRNSVTLDEDDVSELRRHAGELETVLRQAPVADADLDDLRKMAWAQAFELVTTLNWLHHQLIGTTGSAHAGGRAARGGAGAATNSPRKTR